MLPLLCCALLMPMTTRDRNWDGFYNARDLGGLPRRGGGETAFGGYVRSADLRYATPQGLTQMQDAGFSTVVDLRNDFETRLQPRSPEDEQANAHRVPPAPEPEMPAGVFTVRVPMDDPSKHEFWERMRAEKRLGTPRFFAPVLREHPHRVVAVLRALAQAPGNVLYHCAIGRDRTGLVSFALLSLADVEPAAIAADYARSAPSLAPFFARMNFPDASEIIAQRLRDAGFTLEEAVLEQAEGFDAWATLRNAGLSDAELHRLRARLVPEDYPAA